VRGMKEAGTVERVEEKRKAFFKLAQWFQPRREGETPLVILHKSASKQIFVHFAYWQVKIFVV
jgi:hypothetical protein